ncbi:tandem-95 repeat protein, partial [Sphingomonas parva]
MTQLYARTGGEFQFGTISGNGREYSAVAALPGGGYIILWSDHTPGFGSQTQFDVRGQIYNAAGVKVGAEFQVNTTTPYYQFKPQVAVLASGSFVVTWQDDNPASDGSASAIRAQMFTAAGVKTGAELVVNSVTAGTQMDPVITSLSGGGFVIAWSGQDAVNSGAKAQIYTATGAKSGGEITLNTITADSQYQPSLAALASGGFVAAWTDFSRTGGDSDQTAVKLQLFSSTGAKVGGELLVNTSTAGYQQTPEVTALTGGGFVVTWLASGPGGADASGLALYAQLFDSAAQRVGTEFLVNTTTSGDQTDPSVAALPDGGFVVTWENGAKSGAWYPNFSNYFTISGQIFTAMGEKAGAEFLIPTQNYYGRDPAVTVLTSGKILTTWSGGNLGMFARVLEPVTGGMTELQLSHTTVSETAVENSAVAALLPTGAVNDAYSYTLLSDSSGAFTLVGDALVVADSSLLDFESGANVTLRVRAVNLNGDVFEKDLTVTITNEVVEDRYSGGAETLVSAVDANLQAAPVLATLADGSMVTAWQETNAGGATVIKARLIDADGTPTAAAFTVSAATSGVTAPAIAALANGQFVVTWADSSTAGDGALGSIRARIFDAAGAPVGAEFLVNTTAAGNQTEPSVTALTGGGFAIAWTDPSGVGGDAAGSGIKAQRFSDAGARLGGEFLVNTTTANAQQSPSIAATGNGGFVVSWQDNLGGSGFQMFSAAGAKIGPELGPGGSYSYLGTSVHSLDAGRFLVVWGNVAQIYNPDGSRRGAGFTIASDVNSPPAAASLDNGDIVIVWQDDRGLGADRSGDSVRAQVYTDTGEKVGAEFLVNVTTADTQGAPQVTALAGGGFGVSWVDDSAAGTAPWANGIKLRVFTAEQHAPEATNDVVAGTEGTPLVLDAAALVGNDLDFEGDALTIVAVGGARNGTVSLGSDGSVTFTPTAGFSGAATFRYTVSDGAATAEASVRVNVAPGDYNHAPVFLSPPPAITLLASDPEDHEGTGTPRSLFSPDGETVLYVRSTSSFSPGGGDRLILENLSTGEIRIVSSDKDGVPGTGGIIQSMAFAPDASKVVFASSIGSFVPFDTKFTDIFVKDLGTGEIVRVSTDASGAEANQESTGASFSPDGTRVIFESWATNLVAGDTNARSDLFVKTLATGAITRVSTGAANVEANGASINGSFSPDGTKILFESDATNLVTGDTNNARDLFIKDLASGVVTRVSTDGSGNQVSGASSRAIFSPDGTKVAFISSASNLVAGDTNGAADVFVKNLTTGAVERITSGAGVGPLDGATTPLAFSPDGTKLAFPGYVTVPSEGIWTQDIYVRDLIAGTTILVSRKTVTADPGDYRYWSRNQYDSGAASFSPDGSRIIFGSSSDYVAPGIPNDFSDHWNTFIATLGETAALYREGMAPARVAEHVVVDDVDRGDFGGGALSAGITSGAQAGDALALATSARIQLSGDAVSVDGVVVGTFSQTAFGLTIALDTDADADAVEALAEAITIFSTAPQVPGGTRTVTLTLADGGSSDGPSASTSFTRDVAFQVVNDLPVVSGNTAQRSFVEGVNGAASEILVNPTVTLADPDHATLASVTIRIAANLVSGQDVLAFANTDAALFGDIVGSYSAASGTLTLTSPGGGATLAQFEAAARAATYDNSSEDPSTSPRTIEIRAHDGVGAGNSLQFQIAVTRQNDSPSGIDNSFWATEDVAVALKPVHFSYSDVENNGFSGVIITEPPIVGSLWYDNGGGLVQVTTFPSSFTAADLLADRLVYRPPLNLNGNDHAALRFSVIDTGGGSTNTDPTPNTLSFTLSPANDAPVVIEASVAATAIGEDTPSATGQTVSDLFGDAFSDAADAQRDAVTNPAGSVAGTLAGIAIIGNDVSGTAGRWQYWTGAAWQTIGAVSDDSALGLPASTRIRFVPAADYHGDAPGLVVRLIDSSSGGVSLGTTLDVNPNGGATPYSAGTVVLTQTVTSANDAPSVAPNSLVTIAEDNASAATAIGASDPDGDTLSYAVKPGTGPAHGSIAFDQAGGTFIYSPAANYHGTDAFTILVSDGQGGTTEQLVSVSVTSVNDAPTASASRAITTAEDSSSAATAVGATDIDGDTLSYSVKPGAAPAHGSVSFDQPTGTFVYTPDTHYHGADAFTVLVSDGQGGTAEQIVTVTVTPVNDAPSAAASGAVTLAEDTASAATPIGASDPDGDTLSYAVKPGAGPAHGSIAFDQAGGTFIYSPAANYHGTDAFTILVSDGQGGTTE